MANKQNNFCPQCGHKTVARANFCTGCGERIAVQDTVGYLKLAIGVMILSVIIFVGIKLMVPETAKAPVQHTADDGHDHDDHDDHDHDHPEPAELKALREKAANGNPADLMALAEYQIRMREADRTYLYQAAETLQRLLISYPNHAYSWRLLGNIYYDLHESEKAVTAYNRYLKLVPEDANVHTDLGTQYLALENYDQAITQYNEAIRIFPDHYNATYNMSVVYKHMGNTKQQTHYENLAARLDEEKGKLMAPPKKLDRLPTGEAAVAEVSAEPVSTKPVNLVAGDVDYAPVKAFFTHHPVIGPKMVDFTTSGEHAVLSLRQFPMDKMPESMRNTFTVKIENLIGALGEGAGLVIRDADDNRVLASYGAVK